MSTKSLILVKNGIRYTADPVFGRYILVTATGPRANLGALSTGYISWPSDAEVSKLVGKRVRFFDGGDNFLESLYQVEDDQ